MKLLNTEQVKSQWYTKFYKTCATSTSSITGFCMTCLIALLNAKVLTQKSDKSSCMESEFLKALPALQGLAQILRNNRQVLKGMLIEVHHTMFSECHQLILRICLVFLPCIDRISEYPANNALADPKI